MSKVTLGILLCLAALVLLNLYNPAIGLVLFIAGIALMYWKKPPRK